MINRRRLGIEEWVVRRCQSRRQGRRGVRAERGGLWMFEDTSKGGLVSWVGWVEGKAAYWVAGHVNREASGRVEP
jgi:hypothetical protein